MNDDTTATGARGDGTVSVASYNVHGWVGSDGDLHPERTMRVIDALGASMVGVQEATLSMDAPPAGMAHGTTAADLALRTGYRVILGPTLYRSHGHYGNLLLTRWPVCAVARHDLSVPGREPRGVLDVEVAINDVSLRVLVTHLGLRFGERRRQLRQLMDIVRAGPTERVLLMGDLNQWFPWLGTLGCVHDWFDPAPARRSYPSRYPLLPLDRMWMRPSARLQHVWAHRSPLARAASDHLPLLGRVKLP